MDLARGKIFIITLTDAIVMTVQFTSSRMSLVDMFKRADRRR